ncbi:MAG: hypothetical protein LBT78_00395, partial [Tannerella sp.]|nr:hypothetical protein [Tannerella sp.]
MKRILLLVCMCVCSLAYVWGQSLNFGYRKPDQGTVKIHSTKTPKPYLFENTGQFSDQAFYAVPGKHFLGYVNTATNPTAQTEIYLDTAYVNRGTGLTKPQYLLAVEPDIQSDYVYARYLINARDSSVSDPDYLRDSWVRLTYTRAIHANDALYILGNVDLHAESAYINGGMPGERIDVSRLDGLVTAGKIQKVDLNDNTHKNCVFSFRLVENGSNDFLIESEAASPSDVIEPDAGGWIKIQNGVPVIGLSTLSSPGINELEIFNMQEAGGGNVPNPLTVSLNPGQTFADALNDTITYYGITVAQV